MDNIFKPFPTLYTSRLTLRKLETNDDELIFNYRKNKNNYKFSDMPIYTDISEAKGYIDKMNNGIEEGKWIIWAITDKANKILGTISIWNFNSDFSKGELGYGLFPGNIGNGIMSEALKRVTEYAFETLKLTSLEAYTNALNEKSINLLKRNNYNFVEKVNEKTINGIVEYVIYRIENK